MLLEKAGNWGITDGSEPDPAKQPVPAGAQASTDAEKDAWKKKDLEARTEIIMHLGDRQLQLVRTLEISQGMWILLQSQYQQTNVVSRVLLHKQLNEIQMVTYHTTEAFLEAWKSANDNLQIAGQRLEHLSHYTFSHACWWFLSSLPVSPKTIQLSPITTPVLYFLKQKSEVLHHFSAL